MKQLKMQRGSFLSVPLIALMVLVTGRVHNIHGCTLSDEDGAGMAANLMLRAGDIIGNRFPVVGEITGIFWIFYDLSSGNQDLSSQMECYAKKYLREYHMDRLTITINNLNIKFNDVKRDKTKLLELLHEIEHAGVISSVQSNLENTQAAIYPSIAPWSVMHLAVYKQLIGLSTAIRHGHHSQRALQKKSDKWLLFYARLMLRYHRAHKYKMIRSMSHYSVKSSKIHKSPAELVKPWLKLASSSSTKIKMTKMIDSCKLTSGDTVQLKIIYKREEFYNRYQGYYHHVRSYIAKNEFFSCWKSGSYCKMRNCPREDILVRGSTYKYNWACRGETFWIYADQKTINHNTIVNVQYSTKGGSGYWVSGNKFGTSAKTRTCPTQSFTHIRSGCDKENFKISEWDTSTDNGIYDGSFVEFGDGNEEFIFELNIYSSESSKKGYFNAPL